MFITLGLLGGAVAVAPAASADPIGVGGEFGIETDPEALTPLCVRVNATVFGTTVGTGPQPICLG